MAQADVAGYDFSQVSVGLTEKPSYAEETFAGKDARTAVKGERIIHLPGERTARHVTVYDGHKTCHGNHIAGPALLEQVNTTLLLTSPFDCVCDRYGSFVVFQKGQESRLAPTVREMIL